MRLSPRLTTELWGGMTENRKPPWQGRAVQCGGGREEGEGHLLVGWLDGGQDGELVPHLTEGGRLCRKGGVEGDGQSRAPTAFLSMFI